MNTFGVAGFGLAVALSGAASAKSMPTAKTDNKIEAKRLVEEGRKFVKYGEFTAAIADFEDAARRNPTAAVYVEMGSAHYQRGFRGGAVESADRDDAQAAIDAFTTALALDPKLTDFVDKSRIHFSLALCEEAVGAYPKALEQYKAALRLTPNKPLIPLHAARLRLKMQDPEKALENVQMALTMAKKDAIDGALLAQIRRDPSFRGLFADRAIRRALGVTPAPIEVAVNTPAGRPSDLKDAVADRPALAQDPAVVSKLAQGDEEFSARRYATALAAYRTALSLNSARASLTPDAVASLNARIGESYNRLGQSERAIAALNDSLRLNTMNPEARYQLALALAASGRSSSSIDMLRQAFAACVGHADLRRLMIRAKTDAEFEGARALPAFADALDSASSR